MKSDKIFQEVAVLNFPLGQYAVVGSGVLSAHGIRMHNDVDILVTSELYKQLESQGWIKTGEYDHLVKGNVEVGVDIFSYGKYQPDNQKLIKEADVIEGIPFVKLEEVIKFKQALGREKDKKDIELIHEYLSKK